MADDFAVALVKMFGLAVFCDVDSELWRRSRVRRRRVLLRDDARVTAGDFRQVFEESGSSSQLCG